MEDDGNSLIVREPSLPTFREPIRVLAPKDYFLGPVFAATPQKRPRQVMVGDREYVIGGFHPMGGNDHAPALDVRHARVIFSLLSFRSDYDDTCLVRFSFNELCGRYAKSNGGSYARAIQNLVRDLTNAFIRITDTKTNVSHEFRLIERMDIEKRPPRRRDSKLALSGQREMWFNGCTLSPEFAGLLSNFKDLMELNLDVFNSITSPLAQAIFLFLPSRAYHHHTENDPFEITLTNLLQQVSAPVPSLKWLRRKLFVQNSRSILKQLDGIETLSGILRIKLADTADGSDCKLQAWMEKNTRKPKAALANLKLVTAYLASGRTREQLEHSLANIRPLSDYEIDLLSLAKVEYGKNRRFFEQAKALLKEVRFITLLAEAKGDEQEGRKARKNPTARLIYRIMQAISTPPHPLRQMGNTCLDN